MCHFESARKASSGHLIRFDEYFQRELEDLRTYEEAGLVEITEDWISVLPKGKLLVRGIAMVFTATCARTSGCAATRNRLSLR